MTRNLEPGLEPQAHVRVRMYRYSGATMADTDHAFVTTVADNMRQYTKREVAQAKTARQLMARLGYASSQATIDMNDAGMSHCDVTKQDVRNADAIFDSCIPSLRGKTHKRVGNPENTPSTKRTIDEIRT
jgi:hypothetical protein